MLSFLKYYALQIIGIVQLLHILLQNVMQTSLHCTIIHASICLCHRSMTCQCLYAVIVSCQPQSCAGSSGVKNVKKNRLRIIYRKLEDQHRRGHLCVSLLILVCSGEAPQAQALGTHPWVQSRRSTFKVFDQFHPPCLRVSPVWPRAPWPHQP